MVKDNQKYLKESIEGDFIGSFPPATRRAAGRCQDNAATHSKERCRLVSRFLTIRARIALFLTRWPELKQVVRLERTTKRNGKLTIEVQHAINSLSRRQADAAKLIEPWWGSWGIDNRLRWVRDTLWQEDRRRV